MEQDEWRGTFFALLDETNQGDDDAIMGLIHRRFGYNDDLKAVEAHIRAQSARWRADYPNWGVLMTDGSLKYPNMG